MPAYRNILVVKIFLLLFTPLVTFGDVIVVPDDYMSIQDAIDHAANNDRITVRTGEYTETLNISDKTLTLAAYPPGSMVYMKPRYSGLNILRSDVDLAGFSFQTSCEGTSYFRYIVTVHSSRFVMTDSEIIALFHSDNNGAFGMECRDCDYIEMNGCTVIGADGAPAFSYIAGTAVQCYDTTKVLCLNCEFTGGDGGSGFSTGPGSSYYPGAPGGDGFYCSECPDVSLAYCRFRGGNGGAGVIGQGGSGSDPGDGGHGIHARDYSHIQGAELDSEGGNGHVDGEPIHLVNGSTYQEVPPPPIPPPDPTPLCVTVKEWMDLE